MCKQQLDHVSSAPRFLLEPPTIWLFGAVFCVFLNIIVLFAATNPATNDFSRWYYTGALSLRLTGSPYLYSAVEEGLLPYPYPPLLAYLCLPLSWASVTTATYIWAGVNVLLTGLLTFQFNTLLLPREGLSRKTRLQAFLVVLGLLMWYPPQLTGNVIGQMHNLVAISVMACLLSLRSGKNVRAGISLAVATLLKIFPVVMVISLIAPHRKRAMMAFIATGLLFALITWQTTWYYMSSGLLTGGEADPAEAQHYSDVLAGQHYVSLPSMAARMFTANNYSVPLFESRVCRNLFLVVTTSAILIVSIVFLRRRPHGEPAFAALICVSMLIVPAIGYYHLNLALIAVLVCYRSVFESRRPDQDSDNGSRGHWHQRWMILGLVIAFLLTAMPVDYGLASSVCPEWLTPVYTLIHTGWGLFLLTPQTYGLLILLGVCLAVSRNEDDGEDLQSSI